MLQQASVVSCKSFFLDSQEIGGGMDNINEDGLSQDELCAESIRRF